MDYSGYHQFICDHGTYGSFEVFQFEEDNKWYWIAGFPGCLWDSDEANGPFDTAREAYDAAQETA